MLTGHARTVETLLCCVYTRVLTQVQLTSSPDPSSISPMDESKLQGHSHWRQIWVESGLEPSCKRGFRCIFIFHRLSWSRQ